MSGNGGNGLISLTGLPSTNVSTNTVRDVCVFIRVCAHLLLMFVMILKIARAGTRPKGMVARAIFKKGILDCFITEVAQLLAPFH